MLIILFGLSGAGKNFVGSLLQQHFQFYFWDADQVLTAEMLEYVQKQQIFTQDMRDHFVRQMIQEITVLQRAHPKLVVAQALYKESNRQQLRAAFPAARFMHVQAQWGHIMQRLNHRNSVINQAYATKLLTAFETPLLQHQVIVNDTDQVAVIKQLTGYLQP